MAGVGLVSLLEVLGSGSACGGATSNPSGSMDGGGSSVTSDGDNGTSLPEDGFMAAVVGGGPDCPFASPVTNWLSVGSATRDKPTTVTNDGTAAGGTATMDCIVHPDGAGFDISLSMSVAGMSGGNVTISSPAGAGAVTTAGASGIAASFYSTVDHGPYSSTNCTISYTYLGQPVPVSPSVAAGRIWGHIDCADAKDASQSTMAPDGGMSEAACDASADFLFEQCHE